ncbi:phage portal protein [Microbacterium sp. KSW4-17]|uniref:Phage portal protein n=1 Tax=Microbacterium galbum TaxID=3075994 RepID=A0ABU3T8H0_9MICO|nr:phage portal protein [Microbacterium sp. KSW4-17]MDU0367670.1 phage portal protein [Microbacterium sp. KSW4-17]
MHAIVAADIWGTDYQPVTRSQAMQVAPIKRGRSIIVGSLSDLPLESGAWSGETFVPANRQPTWMTQTAGTQTVWHRMAHTLDDLIFYGWSLWAVERSTDTGAILDAFRVTYDRWAFDEHSPIGVTIDGRPVTDPGSVILFAGPDEGLLSAGSETIRGARAMERAWVGRVESPIPAMVLQEVNSGGGSAISKEQAEAYVAAWRAARTAPGGAVGFLPANLSMNVYGETNADLFTEGRNNIRLDVANFLNLPASVLDGSTATASLTYSTAQGEFSQLNSWLEYWLAPIEARLSQDDVTPHGQTVRFDRAGLNVAASPAAAPTLSEGATQPQELTQD